MRRFATQILALISAFVRARARARARARLTNVRLLSHIRQLITKAAWERALCSSPPKANSQVRVLRARKTLEKNLLVLAPPTPTSERRRRRERAHVKRLLAREIKKTCAMTNVNVAHRSRSRSNYAKRRPLAALWALVEPPPPPLLLPPPPPLFFERCARVLRQSMFSYFSFQVYCPLSSGQLVRQLVRSPVG